MKCMEQYAPSDYKFLVKHKRFSEAESEVRKVIKEELNLEKALQNKEDPVQILKEHLSEERIDMIKKAFQMETFTMHADEKNDDLYHVTRAGKQFQPSIKVSADPDVPAILQAASIVIECFILVLNVVGVSVHIGDMSKVVKVVVAILKQTPSLLKVIRRLVDNWSSADGMQKGRLIWDVIVDAFKSGVFWDIIKSVLAGMSAFDWALTAAKIAGTIVAAVATGGLAIAVKISLAVVDAVKLVQKVVNYKHFLSKNALLK